MKTEMNNFFKWAYKTRANTVISLKNGEQMSMEKMFLSFMSHNPIFCSHGPAGLNGSVKGVGFAPKQEYMAAALEDYKAHIATFDKGDKEYSNRGLDVLIKHLYSEEAEANIDFSCLYGVEMAYTQSYENFLDNNEASLVFYQPPVISYELKGTMEMIGTRYDDNADVDPFSLDIVQQFVNAQHDAYHHPDISRWKKRLVYKFTINEIYDKSATGNGFGKKIWQREE